MFSMSLYLLYLIRYSSIFLSSYSEKNTSSVVLSKKQYLNLTYAIFDDKDNSAIFFNKNVKFSKFIILVVFRKCNFYFCFFINKKIKKILIKFFKFLFACNIYT